MILKLVFEPAAARAAGPEASKKHDILNNHALLKKNLKHDMHLNNGDVERKSDQVTWQPDK